MDKITVSENILEFVDIRKYQIDIININEISKDKFIILMKVKNLEIDKVEWIVSNYDSFYKLHNTHYFMSEVKAQSRYNYKLINNKE